MKKNALNFLCLSLLMATASYAADTNPPPCLTIELRDGSRVVGECAEKIFQFHSALLGEIKLDVNAIHSVDCVSSNTAKLVTAGGDALTVSFVDSEFAVKTSFGKVDLQVASLRKLTVTVAGRAVPRRSGLVSLWSAEGSCDDSVGGNNGTLAGRTTYGAGQVGQAFVFQGNADLVTVGNPANLQLQDFTIEAWIKRTDTSVTTHGNYGNGVVFGYGQGGYGLYLDAFGRPVLTKTGINDTKPDIMITDTSFHHVAVTKSGSTVVFYVDGTAYSAPAYNPGFEFLTVAAIGARGDNLDNSFVGLIDEVAVYNRALSPAEIREDFEAGKAN